MKYIHGYFVTPEGTAANNRDEVSGNTTLLKKVRVHGLTYTEISGESIRFALRLRLEEMGLEVNRKWDSEQGVAAWREPGKFDPEEYVDDDIFGYMSTKQDTNARARRSPLSVSVARSMTPWDASVHFHISVPGHSVTTDGASKNPVPFSVEVHHTRYVFGMTLDVSRLKKGERAFQLLEALLSLPSVGGNQARYYFPFAPEAGIIRVTDYPAINFRPPVWEPQDALRAPDLEQKVRDGEIPPKELLCFGMEVAGVKAVPRVQVVDRVRELMK